MAEREVSYQRLDPVGSYGMRPVTLVMSVAIVVFATAATALNWSMVTDPAAACFALVAVALAALGVSFWSSPLRAPFGRTGFVVILVAIAGTIVLSAASSWGSPEVALGTWTPVAVGLTLAQLAPYRSARELASATVLVAILASFVAILDPPAGASVPPLVVVVSAAIPVLGLGLGATAYAAVLARTVGRWYSPPGEVDQRAMTAIHERIVRSVHDDRVGILNDSVVPFLTDLLRRDVITQADRERAVAIATSIRSVMVADVDRSWLDTVVDHVSLARRGGSSTGSEVVQDPDRLASAMTSEQRTVTRALIIALFDHPGFDPDGFAVLISSEGKFAVVTLTAKLDADDSIQRSGLAAYLAVLRVAFTDLHLMFQPPTLTLKFSYDQRCR
ncbi:MAG: hypothetical protein WDM88_02220 [Galbitalea sp.]